MTVLVSGATGFLGGTITRHLLDAGLSVRALSRSVGRTIQTYAAHDPGRRALADGRLTFVAADVTKPDTLPRAVEGVDTIIQAAQFTGAPVEDPTRGLTYDAVDRNGTENLLQAIRKVYGLPATGAEHLRFPAGSPRFVYVSGITVSAGPTHPWDQAKWKAEEAVRGSGLEWTIVRPCWVYGPGDSSLNRILGYSDHLPFVPVFGNGKALLTPLFVEDLGRLFVALLARPDRVSDTTFGAGGPDVVTLDDFLKAALQALGRQRPVLHIPRSVGRLQAQVLQHLPGRVLTPDAVEFVSQSGMVTEADRQLLAERLPDFRATPLREALAGYMGR